MKMFSDFWEMFWNNSLHSRLLDVDGQIVEGLTCQLNHLLEQLKKFKFAIAVHAHIKNILQSSLKDAGKT